MRAPDFWMRDGLLPRLLTPAGALYATATARRVARPGWRAPVPVLCVGNAGVGGAGKTPVVLDLLARLAARGLHPHALTRGHGGRLLGPVRVDPARHTAREVGDEPLLLASVAPCWVGADRAAAARAAIAAGADALVLDDGLQNPSLAKTFSVLVVDGVTGFGNGRVLPAGPLREPVAAALRRVQAAVVIGEGVRMPPQLAGFEILRASLGIGAEFAGVEVAAFAGIGRPEKFFASLRRAGAVLAVEQSFADHHVYARAELARLRRAARGLPLLTTEKDFVRLRAEERDGITPVPAILRWTEPDAIERALDRALSGAPARA